MKIFKGTYYNEILNFIKEEKQRRKSYSKVEILYVNKLTRNHLTDIYQET